MPNSCKAILFFIALAGCVFSNSAEVRFPEEELEAESVLPLFSHTKAVTMNRKVQLKNKLGLQSSVLYRADEPFYDRLFFTGAMEFFFNEEHGLKITGFYIQPGISNVGRSLLFVQHGQSKEVVYRFDASLAPHPHYGGFLSYTVIPVYGKISFSKNTIAHLNWSISAGGGVVWMVQHQRSNYSVTSPAGWSPAGYVELNQKIFIGSRFFLRGGISFLSYYGFEPINKNLLNKSVALSASAFSKSLFLRVLVSGGLGVLLF